MRSLLLLALLLLAGPAGAASSLFDLRGRAVEFLLARLSTPGSFEVTVAGVEAAEGGATVLLGLRVADRDGVWIEAGRVTLAWNASRLLRGELDIPLIRVEDLAVLRRPAPAAEPGAAPAAAPGSPLDWPRSPLALSIAAMRLDRVRIAEGVLPRAIAFDATGTASDAGDVQALALDLVRRDGIPGRIALDLRRTFAERSLALSVTAEEGPGGLVAALAGLPDTAGWRLALAGAGPEADWRATLRAEAEGTLAAEGTAALSWAAPLAVSADLALRPGPALPPDLAALVGTGARLSVRVAEAAEIVRVERFAIASPALAATGSGEFRRADGSADLALSVTAEGALAALAPGLGFDRARFEGRVRGDAATLAATGTVALEGLATEVADAGRLALSAELSLAGGVLAFRTEGTGTGLRLDRIGPELLGEARLAAEGRIAGGRIALAAARLSAAPLSLALDGTAATDGSTFALAYRIEAPDLAPLAARYGFDAAARLDAEGRVEGTAEAPRLAGRIVAGGLRIGPRALGDLTLDHDIGPGAEGVAGAVAAALGPGAFGPARLTARIAAGPAVLRLDALALTLPGAVIEGRLALDPRTMLAEGDLALRLADPGPLAAVAGLALSGSGEGSLRLDPGDGRQALDLALTLRTPGLDGVRAGSLRATASLRDLTGAATMRATAELSDLSAGPVLLARARATLDGPLAGPAFALDGTGTLRGEPLAFALAGQARLAGEPALALARLRVEAGPVTLAQEGGPELRFGTAGPAVRGLALDLAGGGRVAGDLALAPGGLRGRLEAVLPDLVPFATLAGLGRVAGRLEAEAALQPGGSRIAARVTGLRHPLVPEDAGLLSADLAADWSARAADLALTIRGDFGAPVQATLRLPLRPGGPLPRPDPGGALAGTLAWAGEVAPLWALLPLPDHVLTGAARVALRLQGTLARPAVAGDLALSGGRYQNLTAGLILTDLVVTSRVEDRDALALDLSARDGAEGRVTGRLRLAPGEGGPSLDAGIAAEKAVLVRRDDVTARLSGEIAAKGPLTALTVAGRIAIDRAEVRLVDAAPPAILSLGPVRVKGERRPGGETERPGRIRLDIAVAAPGAIFARGRGLDSEWRADLRIAGTARQPRLRGTIERLRGRFDLLGKPFTLVKGEVRFVGGAEIDPDLDIVFERSANGITGRIAISGSMRAPEIAFSSTPALPPDEVLPRLLFGTSRQALSGAQAVQLAVGLRQLATGSPGPLDVARDALGFDVLQVDPGEDGRVDITVGRTVAPGVFVGAKRDLTGDGGTKATVEIEVFGGLKVQGEVGPESSAVGLEWQKDF